MSASSMGRVYLDTGQTTPRSCKHVGRGVYPLGRSGAIPSRSGARPESLGRSPESLGRSPESLGRPPESLGRPPRSLMVGLLFGWDRQLRGSLAQTLEQPSLAVSYPVPAMGKLYQRL